MRRPHASAAARAAVLAGSLALLVALAGSRPVATDGIPAPGLCAEGNTSMAREIRAWYAEHPAHGTTVAAGGAADTFLVGSFWFNTDGSLATQVDTARIEVGQSVLFKWSAGFHTATSGIPGAIDAGALFDHPIDSGAANQEFLVTFANPGTFPFHCRPHGQFFNMRGVVVVQNATTGADGVAPRALRFAAPPAPNPARGAVTMRLAMPRDLDAQVTVLDAAGRIAAVLHDGALAAGTHDLRWDGRVGGRPAAPGVYVVLARAGAERATQRVVLTR